ncbi:uncharacterized protein [Bactrocera oleae]|uniref:uncharacterized protein n=1 Tax=Bactrocera oleae TaxID=104688 RepID=UPI00387E27B6
MPPPRRRRVKSLAGSEESGPSTITVDFSGDETAGPSVRSPSWQKARLGSAEETGGEEGWSGSCSGCGKGDTAEKVAVHHAKSGECEKCLASAYVGAQKSGAGEVGLVRGDAGATKTGANKASASKFSAGRDDSAKGSAIIAGGGAVSHVAAIKKISRLAK